MTWLSVARKDFRDSVRSRTLLLVVALFVGILGILSFALAWFQPDVLSGDEPADFTVAFLSILSGNFPVVPSPVPPLLAVIGLLLGYKAIVGERETGQLKFLLGLPNTRTDVVIGKLAGRAAVGGVAAVIGLSVSLLILGVVSDGPVAVEPFVQFAAVTIALVLVHVSMGIGISAAVPTSGWATAIVVLVVGVFQIAWTPVFQVAGFVGFDGGPPPWFRFLQSTRPGSAYRNTLDFVVFGDGGQPADAIYLADWFGVVLLAFWFVVPLGLGYVSFRRAELG